MLDVGGVYVGGINISRFAIVYGLQVGVELGVGRVATATVEGQGIEASLMRG